MIHFVIGTRAQMLKMAPIMAECQRRNYNWRWVYVAQHKETMLETIEMFNLPSPAYTVVEWDDEAKTIFKYGYWMLRAFGALFKGRKILAGYIGKSNVVLTHGDTTSTVWGAFLGKLYGCKVMHVESGLRSFNLFEPFPEEINRLITFRLTDIYACPGDWALSNVSKYKGIKLNTIENTQVDTVRYGAANSDSAEISVPAKPYFVATIHRYENIFKEEKFTQIIDYLLDIAKTHVLAMPLHPVTRVQLEKYNLLHRLNNSRNVKLYSRLEYLPFIKLAKSAEFVITDGGGTQEELYHMGIPTLLFRNETERQEGLGRTTVISKFDPKVINDFVDNYKKYRHLPTATKTSPTKIILDKLEKMNLAQKSAEKV